MNAVLLFAQLNNAQIVSAGDGGWNQTLRWLVVLFPVQQIMMELMIPLRSILQCYCNDLTINDKLRFAIDGTVTGITVNGNITINYGRLLRVEASSPATSSLNTHEPKR